MWDWVSNIGEWFSAMGPYVLATIAWLGLLVGVLGGLVGVFLPVIPGAIVLWLTVLVHKLMLPDMFSWWGVWILFAFVLIDRVVDFAGTALGTKWFGGSKWAIFGAVIGGLVGIFFGPLGLILGPVAGAFSLELIAAKAHPKVAAKSGVGAGVGFGISTLGRFIVCLLMIGGIVADLVI